MTTPDNHPSTASTATATSQVSHDGSEGDRKFVRMLFCGVMLIFVLIAATPYIIYWLIRLAINLLS